MEPTLDSDTIETEKKCMRKCTRTLGLVEKVAINTSDKFILGATIVYVQNVKIEKCRNIASSILDCNYRQNYFYYFISSYQCGSLINHSFQ